MKPKQFTSGPSKQPKMVPLTLEQLVEAVKETPYYTEAQVMLIFGVARSTLYRWRKKGLIDFERIGGTIYYPRITLLKMYEAYSILQGFE